MGTENEIYKTHLFLLSLLYFFTRKSNLILYFLPSTITLLSDVFLVKFQGIFHKIDITAVGPTFSIQFQRFKVEKIIKFYSYFNLVSPIGNHMLVILCQLRFQFIFFLEDDSLYCFKAILSSQLFTITNLISHSFKV